MWFSTFSFPPSPTPPSLRSCSFILHSLHFEKVGWERGGRRRCLCAPRVRELFLSVCKQHTHTLTHIHQFHFYTDTISNRFHRPIPSIQSSRNVSGTESDQYQHTTAIDNPASTMSTISIQISLPGHAACDHYTIFFGTT